MTRRLDGAPIARHLIFVRKDGAFVVQWDAGRTQDMLTGRLHPFEDKDFGHAITDYELEQLREAGRLSHYDRSYVWLYSLPEGERFRQFQVRDETAGRSRYFYLNTTLPEHVLDIVEKQLHDLGLDTRYAARAQSGMVAIMNQDGQPFDRLAEVEMAQNTLRRAAPQLLEDAAVAFIEINVRGATPGEDFDSVNVPDLDTLIASQTQQIGQAGKVIVGVDGDEDFLLQIAETIRDLGAEFVATKSGQEALHKIEDLEPDLVLMDLVMPDIHAWQILDRMRSNQALAPIPVIIVSALGSQSDQVFALTVAKVHDFLVKPVAPGLLRKSIWTALENQ